MPTVTLTDRFCSTAKALGVQTDYFDETVQGLALRVSNRGNRSWCFHYRSPRDGKRARATFATYPATSLAMARGRALEAKGHVDAGSDPRLVLSGLASAGMTIAALVDAYLTDPEKSALRSKAEIERRLRRNLVPVIGAVKLSELRRRDVRNVTDAMLRRGVKVEATRVFEDCRALVRWAIQHEYLDSNPLDGMTKPAEATFSNRVLSDDEIRALWHGLPKTLAKSVQCQRVIKLCLATGQRVGEVAGIVRSEIDLKKREWRLPANRVKNNSAHIVPLSNLAIQIIKEAMADAGEGAPLFPCGTGSLSPIAVARTILRANDTGRFGIAAWSAHDLRRTCLDNLAKLGVLPVVIGHVANHRSVTKGGVTFAHYVQHSYEAERRDALDLWANRLAAIVGDQKTASVVPMRRRKPVA